MIAEQKSKNTVTWSTASSPQSAQPYWSSRKNNGVLVRILWESCSVNYKQFVFAVQTRMDRSDVFMISNLNLSCRQYVSIVQGSESACVKVKAVSVLNVTGWPHCSVLMRLGHCSPSPPEDIWLLMLFSCCSGCSHCTCCTLKRTFSASQWYEPRGSV